MSKVAEFVEKWQWYYLTLSWKDKVVQYLFPKSIRPKVNIKVRVAFELN